MTRSTSVNATIAHFTVTREAAVADLKYLFGHTPGNIVIVSYDEWGDESTQIEAAVHRAVEELNKEEERRTALWGDMWCVIGEDGAHRQCADQAPNQR